MRGRHSFDQFHVNGKTDWMLKRRLLGRAGEDWAAMVIEEYGLHKHITPRQLVREWEQHLEQLYSTVGVLPGADALTARLASANIPMAIATSSNREAVSKKRAAHPEVFARMQVRWHVPFCRT